MSWTADQIPGLNGKTVVITGANSGLGFQTALSLAKKNATIIMACRNKEKAEKSMENILQLAPSAKLKFVALDLANLSSIRQFANVVLSDYAQLDLLINNAGIGGISYGVTSDGFEKNFGTNHLGHFVLTGLLFELLKQTDKSRVVTVSSEFNRLGKSNFEDLNYKKNKYSKWEAYGRSKLANALFGFELDRRVKMAGYGVKSVVVHPGYSNTNLQQRGPELDGKPFEAKLLWFTNTVIAQSEQMGALPTLYAATGLDLNGGEYIGPRVLRWRGRPVKQKARGVAYNLDLARELWQLSEQLTHFNFKF